jgi:hypothetical protein
MKRERDLNGGTERRHKERLLAADSEFATQWRWSQRFAAKGLMVALAGAALSVIAMIPGLSLLGLVGFVTVGLGVVMGFIGVLRPFGWLLARLFTRRK